MKISTWNLGGHWDLREVGSLLCARRKALKLNQEDLVICGKLSRTTISNLESGKKPVSRQKLQLYCQQINLNVNELPNYLKKAENKEVENSAQIDIVLRSIESHIDANLLSKAKGMLNTLKLRGNDPNLGILEFLKGKYYSRRKNWSKSKNHIYQAIRLSEDEIHLHPNIKAASLYELACISAQHNDFEQALTYVNNGILSFHSGGERIYIKDTLSLGKAIFLEKLELNKEATMVLDKMWSNINSVDTIIKLNMLQLRSVLLKKEQNYKEAINFAKTGLEIARREHNYDRCYESWTTLGSIYKEAERFQVAELCFNTASDMESLISNKYLIANNNKELGLLYLEMDKIHDAEKQLLLAVRQSTNDALKKCESLFSLGICYFQQQKFEDAIEQFKLGYQIAQKHYFRIQEQNIVFKLALCYKNTKDLANHQRFASLYIDITEKITDRGDRYMENKNNELKLIADPPTS